MPSWADFVALFPTWHELSAGIVVNLLTQPVQWLVAFLLAFLIRERRMSASLATDASPESAAAEPARSPVVVVLDAIMFVSFMAVFGPLAFALVFAAAAFSVVVAIFVVVLAVAFFVAAMWWLVGLFTGRYDEPRERR